MAFPGSDKSRRGVGKGVVVLVTVGGGTYQNQTSVAHVKDALPFPPYLAAYRGYGILHLVWLLIPNRPPSVQG